MTSIALLYDIGLVIIVATILAILARWLKQPLILGYVAAGIIIGPTVLGLIKNQDSISILSELGITFLLFMIGLELDINKLKQMGLPATIGGTLQVLFTFLAAFGVTLLLGFKYIEAIYIGLVISFSSTLIVVKLLSDKGELDSLHGKIILGILIIQDVLAVLALSLLNTINNFSLNIIITVLFKGFSLFLIAYILSKYVLKYILNVISKSNELLFIGALSLCFLFAYFASFLGYSIAIGAFIAGVTLASSYQNLEIAGRIKPLRDFFLVLFFVSLGMQIIVKEIAPLIVPIVIFFLLTIIAKPIIIFIIMKFLKFGNRTSFFTGMNLGQISEFSLIVAAQGLVLGHISQSMFSAVTLLTIVTIVLTAYFIKWDDKIFSALNKIFAPFESKKTLESKFVNLPDKPLKDHIIVFGIYRMGLKVIDGMMKLKKNFIVVDFNPEKIRDLIKKGVHCICGDMSNLEILEELNIDKAKMVISTVHIYENSALIIKKVREVNKEAIIIVSSRSITEALSLYEHGADYVIVPESLAGEKIYNYMVHLTLPGIKKWGKVHYKSLVDEEKRLNELSRTFAK